MNAIDTNVLVYRVDYDEPDKQAAASSLLRDLGKADDVILPWQVLAEFARWLTAREHAQCISRATVEDYLRSVRSTLPLVMPTPNCLDRALELASGHSLSYWDSMLLAACLEAGVTTLYTEDMGAPRTIDSLELINPF